MGAIPKKALTVIVLMLLFGVCPPSGFCQKSLQESTFELSPQPAANTRVRAALPYAESQPANKLISEVDPWTQALSANAEDVQAEPVRNLDASAPATPEPQPSSDLHSQNSADPIVSPPPDPPAKTGTRIDFETVLWGGPNRRGTSIVRTEADWQKLWEDCVKEMGLPEDYPRPPRPQVDFDNYMLIGVFKGACTGEGLKITSVSETEDALGITAIDYNPGNFTVAAVVTCAGHIIKLPKSDKDVVFNTRYRIGFDVTVCEYWPHPQWPWPPETVIPRPEDADYEFLQYFKGRWILARLDVSLSPSLFVDPPLQPDEEYRKYQWRLRLPVEAGGTGEWSGWNRFAVGNRHPGVYLTSWPCENYPYYVQQ